MAGCTANVVLITENEIYCANAGDSRSILRIGNVIKIFKYIIGNNRSF
jgi:serine/threonine protein phosphatase PrpC